MFAARVGSEKFDLYLPLDFIFAEVCGAHLDLVPFERALVGSLDLRLVNWTVLSRRDVPIDDEEAEARVWKCRHRVEHGDL